LKGKGNTLLGFQGKFNEWKFNVKYIVCVALLFSLATPCFGQAQLYLQHRYKPHRQENISLIKEYTFKTADSTFAKYRIATFSEEDLLIHSISRGDTIQLPIEDIERLTRVRKFGLFEAIGTLGLVCLVSAPALWVTGRGDEASDMMLISGFLFTVSVPIIAVRRIGTKRNTKTKWTIHVNQ
jgi:hypothetical protein